MQKPMRNPTKPHVMAVIPRYVTACESYRVVWPLQEIEKAGWNVVIVNAETLSKYIKRGVDVFAGLDLLLFDRVTVDMDGHENKIYQAEIEKCHKAGCAVGIDYDDDLTNQYRIITDGKLPELKWFDFVTVSTPILRGQLAGCSKEIQVIPNGVCVRDLNADPKGEPFPRVTPYPTIGLSGSPTHQKDWTPAVEALKILLARGEDIHVLVSGFVPEGLQEYLGSGRVMAPYEVVPDGYPLTDDGMRVSLPYYGFFLANTDLQLAPVDPDDLFNWSKSNIKVTEAFNSIRSDIAVAAVATGGKLPIYQDALKYGGGLLVKDHANVEEWAHAIKSLLGSLELHQRIAAQEGVRWRVENFTLRRMGLYQRYMNKVKARG